MAEGKRKREKGSKGKEAEAGEEKDARQSDRRKENAAVARPSRTRPPQPEENSIRLRAPRERAEDPKAVVAEPKTAERAQLPLIAAEKAAGAKPAADPWTVPQEIRDRFTQDGRKFYFPDGHLAFQDRGRKLTTQSENTVVIHSLVQIAASRGWQEIAVGGTEHFRQEAWRQARLAGLSVKGYRANDVENAQLMRRIAARGEPAVDARARDEASPPSDPPATGRNLPRAAGSKEGEMIVGRLLEHGRENYRFAPHGERSYFVRLETAEGKREFWGKDLERAVRESLTQPQIGAEVGLRRTGKEAVTVLRRTRDGEGNVVSEKELDTHRNRWVLESKVFFDKRAAAAEALRNDKLEPREAVREHPELAGTYFNMRAAELAAKAMRDPADRKRFVGLVRQALADAVERGEPLQPVRIREKASTERLPQRSPREIEPPHVRG